MSVPRRCVVDTNVATTANGANEGAPIGCVAKSARALLEVMAKGHVCLDDRGLIVKEYRANLRARGEPGPGDAFLKWLLTNEWGERVVSHVPITPREDGEGFVELPEPPPSLRYDRSDEKFLAVAAADPGDAAVLQSFDSKWWGWQEALVEAGIHLHFVCAEDIARKHAEKTGR